MKLAQWVNGRLLPLVVFSVLAAGCQTPKVQGAAAPGAAVAASESVPARIVVDAPLAWGGQTRCGGASCRLAVVEHEEGFLAVHELRGRSDRLLDRQPLAYHPDSAVWLTDTLLAAAVEGSMGIDLFRIEQDRLVRVHQVTVGFSARDVVVAPSQAGRQRVLVTPYSGSEVAWVEWPEGNPAAATVQTQHWCKTPWHPVHVDHLPGVSGGGFAVACLDGRRVVALPDGQALTEPPRVLATFPAVPRQVRPSPSGRWLYVALETGGRNVRINMANGELQWLAGTPNGSVSVAPLADDLVIWGEDSQLTLQRLDAQGAVLETRGLRTSGFSTGLQLVDADGDGQLDVVVLNSSGTRSDVIYGPLWEHAKPRP